MPVEKPLGKRAILGGEANMFVEMILAFGG